MAGASRRPCGAEVVDDVNEALEDAKAEADFLVVGVVIIVAGSASGDVVGFFFSAPTWKGAPPNVTFLEGGAGKGLEEDLQDMGCRVAAELDAVDVEEGEEEEEAAATESDKVSFFSTIAVDSSSLFPSETK